MGGPPNSQVAPLPTNLPFRLISKTIGSGAYASIRKAVPVNASSPIIAVKFINKDHAFRTGRLRPKQLEIEASLHHRVSKHPNIISFINHGGDNTWVWMCMELAEGGDLFDKIEADEGVGEDVAHFYFTQLVAAIDWCHGHGVAHRDIKPENMLLSAAGDLRLADFGLATQFLLPDKGEHKMCSMVCGSPPYIAPEILAVGTHNSRRKATGEEKMEYDPQIADVWSCAIVLFVLLVGNTPWDAPIQEESYEYYEYIRTRGRPSDELWANLPTEALSLIRGMLNIGSANQRFTLDAVRKHPWTTRANPHLNSKGLAANPVGLATQMLESLRIDFSAPIRPSSSQRQSQLQQSQQQQQSHDDAFNPDKMEIDSLPVPISSTQPETPIADIAFDWELPPRSIPGSQPVTSTSTTTTTTNSSSSLSQSHILDLFASDPSLSQFSATPSVPLTLTQAARKFKDIVPSHSLARFISTLSHAQLLPMLCSALHRLNVPVPTPTAQQLLGQSGGGSSSSSSSSSGNGLEGGGGEEKEKGRGLMSLRVKTTDARNQPLHGNILIERIPVPGQVGLEVLEVRFMKAKGDPVGWRRFFKQVAVLCKDGVVIPQ